MTKLALPGVIESGLNEAGTAVAVIVHPERGTGAIIEYANEPFSAVMRRRPSELTGATVKSVLDLIRAAGPREQLLQSLRSGSAIQLDLPLVTESGESWLGMRLSFPPPGVSGVRNAILIGRDITVARKNASQEEKMRQMLAQIFMRINAPVTIVGRQGELVMCNTAYRQLTGFSADELKRMRAQDMTPPELVELSTKAREAQFADGERFELDSETLVKGGSRVAVRLTSVLLQDNDQDYRVVTLIPRAVPSSAGGGHVEAAALTAAIQVYATRDRGELRAVSLEALRALCGDDWERIAVRAMLRAEQSIRKRLGRDDVVSRIDDSKFVLWFSSDDQSRNAATLQAIVRDIRLSFLTEFGEEIASHVSATMVPGIPPAPPPAAAAKAPTPAAGYTVLHTSAAKAVAD